MSVFRPPRASDVRPAVNSSSLTGKNLIFSPVFAGKVIFLQFLFGEYTTDVKISLEFNELENYINDFTNSIVIADNNTASIAEKFNKKYKLPHCILESGEENKNWSSVEKILSCAHNANLGRDGLFIAFGGGVIGDLSGFAASIYKRGCRFILISTTLLGMVDASVGGKTGFDFLEIKNLAGTFYPAEKVFIPLDTLSTLPQVEWKSGMAELIKTAVLCEDDVLFNMILENIESLKEYKSANKELLLNLVEKAVSFKGSIVSEDPKETGTKRVLLNLGHTFGHALESACGLGNISHGEAVAWGMVRSCELGCALGITPKERANKIIGLIKAFNYNCASPYPLAKEASTLLNAMKNDKKNKNNALRFIVPDAKGARSVNIESEKDLNTIISILKGEITL